MINRRSVLRGLALAPVVFLAPRWVLAKEPVAAVPAAGGNKALGESEPLAKAMQYVADASKASPARSDKTAICGNCSKYNKCSPADKTCKPASASAAHAPCEIFSEKTVAKAGWCLSWSKKV